MTNEKYIILITLPGIPGQQVCEYDSKEEAIKATRNDSTKEYGYIFTYEKDDVMLSFERCPGIQYIIITKEKFKSIQMQARLAMGKQGQVIQ